MREPEPSTRSAQGKAEEWPPEGPPFLGVFEVVASSDGDEGRPAAPALASRHQLGPMDAAVAPCGRHGRARAPPRPPTPMNPTRPPSVGGLHAFKLPVGLAG